MKVTLVFLTIAVCFIASTQGFRYKRTLSHEYCPKNVDCKVYAKKEAEKLGPCSSHETDGYMITYLTCGRAYCGENTRKVQDLNKPYPKCCPDCEVIDPSKPASYSRTL